MAVAHLLVRFAWQSFGHRLKGTCLMFALLSNVRLSSPALNVIVQNRRVSTFSTMCERRVFADVGHKCSEAPNVVRFKGNRTGMGQGKHRGNTKESISIPEPRRRRRPSRRKGPPARDGAQSRPYTIASKVLLFYPEFAGCSTCDFCRIKA